MAAMERFVEDDDIEVIVTLVSTGQLPGFSTDYDDESDDDPRPRKRNKHRDFAAASERYERFYFSEDCVYSNEDFKRRFRMPREAFDEIENAVVGKGELVDLRVDATGYGGVNTHSWAVELVNRQSTITDEIGHFALNMIFSSIYGIDTGWCSEGRGTVGSLPITGS